MTPLCGGGSVARTMWFVAASCLAVIGLAAALVFMDWLTILIVFAVTVGVIAPLHLSVATVTEEISLGLVRMVIGWAARAGALVLVICGYAGAIGLAALPLAGVVAATAVFAFGLPTNHPTDEAVPDRTEVADQQVLGDPASLSDEELCEAWRRSFAVLKRCRTSEDQQAVADLRRRCLDELERRRPDAFAEWLRTDPRAAEDPAKYFVRDGHRDTPD